MEKLLVLTTSAFILACAAITASAQQSPGTSMMQGPDQQQTQQQSTDQDGCGMHKGMMGRGMMGHAGRNEPFYIRLATVSGADRRTVPCGLRG
jgi:hypothetical protein